MSAARSMIGAGILFGIIQSQTAQAKKAQDSYKSHKEINSILQKVATDFPEFTHLEKMGTSRLGRDIFVLSLFSGEPSHNVFINGAHHGDEKASAYATLGLIKYLTQNRDEDRVSDLLSNFKIYIQPVVNPDGYDTNSRFDSMGIDPNRDYSFPGRSDDKSFRSPETRAVKNLLQSVPFIGSISFHSGMEGVLWPWCHSPKENPHSKEFRKLARDAATAMDIVYYRQSHFDYSSRGEFIDYAYMKYQTLALTFEVSLKTSPHKNTIEKIVQRSIAGSLAYLESLKLILESTSRT